MNGADPNISNSDGWTPLHIAACYGDDEVILALLEGDANPNETDEVCIYIYMSRTCCVIVMDDGLVNILLASPPIYFSPCYPLALCLCHLKSHHEHYFIYFLFWELCLPC